MLAPTLCRLFIILLLLQSCSSSLSTKIAQASKLVEANLLSLRTTLDLNALENAKLINLYIKLLEGNSLDETGLAAKVQQIILDSNLSNISKQRLLQHNMVSSAAQLARINISSIPLLNAEEKKMLSILAEAATTSSPQFINLNARLNDLEHSLKKGSGKEEILEEINSLLVASEIKTFNDSLIDIVNVLADLSQQSLPGINQTQAKKDKSNSQAGSYLVGNPNYGSWQTRGSGSIWVWYAQYSLFNSLFYRPYYYHSWYYNRPYSHYNDYAAKNYASQKYRRNINNIHQRNYTKTRAYGKSHNLRYKDRVNRPKRLSSYAIRSHRLGVRSRSRFGGK
ncbi:hypothetical protein OAT97_00315 [Gammaproteobacteria bacterium]|nr:hypothetical protein [Gammaproteobacteria bacterium]